MLILVGCASLLDSGNGDEAGQLRAQNKELRAENEELQAEIEDLQAENEDLQAELAEASTGDGTSDVESPEVTQEEAAVEESSGEPSSEDDSAGGSIEVAGPGDVSGESVPEIMPEDFPLPAGAVLEYTNEGDYNFSLDLVLDSDLGSITAFYEEQLQSRGWKEVDRTEYEQDGLEGVETSWERGTYIPEGSPNDPDYEQTDETLSLTLQEIQPSGVAGRLLWNSYKMLDESN
jgi:hypothetical protein